jgi:hypothetical protein
MGFTKLFSRIIASSIWNEDVYTKVVWITLLAMKGRDQIVESSLGGLATLARISMDECVKAVGILESPDPDDSSGVADGRRIERVQGGWLIINGAAYQDAKDSEERKVYMAAYMRNYRRKQSVNNRKHPLARVSLLDLDKTETRQDNDLKTASVSVQREMKGLLSSGVGTKKQKPSATPSERRSSLLSEICEELKPLYPGVNIDAELRKIKAWQTIPRNSKRNINRQFLVNWLNKIDVPIEIKKKSGPMPLSAPLPVMNGEPPTEETKAEFRKMMNEAKAIANKRIP